MAEGKSGATSASIPLMDLNPPSTKSRSQTGLESDEQPAWKPAIFDLSPLCGIAALGLAIICLFAALAVLLSADKQPVTDWYLAPAVYLAILTALSNAALSFALAQAVPLAWWSKASYGSTIDTLQRQWEVGQSLFRAIQHGRHITLLSIASIAAALVIIDGPLLQRALTVVSATQSSPTALDLMLAPELPTGFSGIMKTSLDTQISPAGRKVALQWKDDEPIQLNAPKCRGSCEATVDAPGIQMVDCHSHLWPISSTVLHQKNSSWGAPGQYMNTYYLASSAPVFVVQLASVPNKRQSRDLEIMSLGVGRANWTDYKGVYNQTMCTLVPVVAEYDITVENNVVTKLSQKRASATANNTHALNLQYPKLSQNVTSGALADYLALFVGATATAGYNPASKKLVITANEMTMNTMGMKYLEGDLSDPGTLVFSDPTDDILASLSNLMFRGSILAASWPNTTSLIDRGLSLHQTVTAKQTTEHNIYQSNLSWYAGAAALQIVTILVIAPLFWDWWRQGVPLTLSPLDIAKAFDAPMFKAVNSAAGSRGVVQNLGNVNVKYGLVHDDRDATPEDGSSAASGRLGIAESENVSKPRRGMRFAE